MAATNDWNAQIISEFRENGGRTEQFGDAPLVILHTIGAKSGTIWETPLVALVDGDDRYVFASKAGAPDNPDWYYNLKANPEIDVEEPGETYRANLVELPEAEADAKLQEQAEVAPTFGEYVTSAAPRKIPAFKVERL